MKTLLISLALACPAARAAACPDLGRVLPEWEESSDAAAPAALVRRHLSASAGPAAPLRIDAHSSGWWLGLSHRGGPSPAEERDPACFLNGTVAYYVLGPESGPELDFVAAVRAGREASLGARLVVLRWFEPADGRRRRWRNLPLARELGWLSDGWGREEPPDYWPNPLIAALNTLY